MSAQEQKRMLESRARKGFIMNLFLNSTAAGLRADYDGFWRINDATPMPLTGESSRVVTAVGSLFSAAEEHENR
jgi:hypothetical protein